MFTIEPHEKPHHQPVLGLLRLWPSPDDRGWVVQRYQEVHIDHVESRVDWVAVTQPMSHGEAYDRMEALRSQQ